jgi:DNA-binding transcriptional ArsR family regulator
MAEPRSRDAQLAKVFSHPMRLRILELVADRGETSPNQLATVVGASVGAISYHVRVLHDEGWLELSRTQRRRGAIEHFYRVTRALHVEDAQWERLPVEIRRQLVGRTLGQILRAASSAAGAGGFDSPAAHISRLPLHLDDQGHAELAKVLVDAVEEAVAVQRRSDERTARSATATTRSQLAILHYPLADDG